MAMKTVTLPKTGNKIVLAPKAHRLLEKALTAMVRRPETFDMGSWLSHDPTVKSSTKTPKPYCGTVACLAGHINLAAGIPPVAGGRLFHPRDFKGLPDAQKVFRACCKNGILWVGHADLANGLMGGGIEHLFYETEIKTPFRMVQRVKRWLRTGK